MIAILLLIAQASARLNLNSISVDDLALFTLTNAARTAPSSFARSFGNSPACAVRSGLAPLSWHLQLYSSARSHSNDMASNGCFSHSTCNCRGSGCDVFSRIARFYSGSSVGENIARGVVPIQAMNMWLESQGHCENIFSTRYEAIGISFVNGYSTQDFGSVATSSDEHMGSYVGDDRFIFLGNGFTGVGPEN